MDLLRTLALEALGTTRDLVPIAILFAVFHVGAVRTAVPNVGRILAGLVYVVVGLTLFRAGLAASVLPTGATMAAELVERAVDITHPGTYVPIVVFSALIGFTATLIEPTLIAVAERLRELSGGTVRPWSLRLVVALGVAAGLAVGTVRIVTGIPFEPLLCGAVILVGILALTAPRTIVPLALDSGGIATSVVTVPLIASYGIATANAMPGRAALTDGFGLIVLALFGPAASLLLFAHVFRLYTWLKRGDKGAI
ncbi:MAG TPA: DUF1538 domain-containing protein [Gammaproteobacteria bacterium]